METTIRRDDAAGLVFLTITGHQTLAETIALEYRLAQSGAWGFGWLIDQQEAHVGLSAQDVQAVFVHAQTLTRTYGPRGPVAVVAGADAAYGVNRMGSAYADLAGFRFQACRTMEEAAAWLRSQIAK